MSRHHLAVPHRAGPTPRPTSRPGIEVTPLDAATLAGLTPLLHPALREVQRFATALLTLAPADARRLRVDRPDVRAAVRLPDRRPLGLAWLAGHRIEVVAAPGRAHGRTTRRLLDTLLAAARARGLPRVTAQLAGPFDDTLAIVPPAARVLAARDTLVLQLHLTASLEALHVAP